MGVASASWGDHGVAAHSTRSVRQTNPCGHADGGICHESAQFQCTNRGYTEAIIASETRFCFLSGAAIAYVELAAYKLLPPEVFCTYHVDQSG